MIRPVQRVCQYPLLFREVLKHLQNDDPGAADFARMVGQMEETIETVNEKVRAQENGLRMRGILTAELQGAGLADLISPSRALVHEAIEGCAPRARPPRVARQARVQDLRVLRPPPHCPR